MSEQLYTVVIRVKTPGREPANLTHKWDWMDALQRGDIIIEATFPRSDEPPADDKLAMDTERIIQSLSNSQLGGVFTWLNESGAHLLADEFYDVYMSRPMQPIPATNYASDERIGEMLRANFGVDQDQILPPSPASLVERVAAIERRLDELAPAVYLSDAHAPRPSRLTELEIEQERLGDAISSLGQQVAKLEGRTANIMRMARPRFDTPLDVTVTADGYEEHARGDYE